MAACLLPDSVRGAGRGPDRDALNMNLVRIVRTILAVLLAVSVAALPAAAGAIAAAGTKGDARAATAQAAAMPADCAHHHAPADRGQKGMDDGASPAACAVHCFNFAGTVVPGVIMLPKASQLPPLGTAGRIASNIAAPPFRPPRI
jgi:hypothetical protein